MREAEIYAEIVSEVDHVEGFDSHEVDLNYR